MLGVGRLTPPPLSVIRPTTTYKHHSCISPLLHHHHTLFLLLKRNGFCLHAQKKQQNSSLTKIKLEEEDFDDGSESDEDDDFDEFDDEMDDEIGDDDELMVPLHKMDDWLRKKPRGFGEGKIYDTSIEDKLLEELENIREAQLANVTKLKNEPIVPDPKKQLNHFKASEVAPGFVRIRVSNLPKKKNIHRDLKSAFEGVNGITNIVPAVTGTKKTRDPVCKGFSFVDFKSLEDANRFVQLFSGQNIAFGKMEKRIKCEILKPRVANKKSVHDGHNNIISESSNSIIEEEGVQVGDIGEHDPQLDSWEDNDFDESDDDDFDEEEIARKINLLHLVEKSDIESMEARLLKKSFAELPTKPKAKSVPKKKIKLLNPVEKSDVESVEARLLKKSVYELPTKPKEKSVSKKKIKLLNTVEKSDVESVEARLLKQSFDELSTKPREKSVRKKKPVVKKPDNPTKLKVPGSAKRLKVHEKAKLADVYSRYGVKQEALASNET